MLRQSPVGSSETMFWVVRAAPWEIFRALWIDERLGHLLLMDLLFRRHSPRGRRSSFPVREEKVARKATVISSEKENAIAGKWITEKGAEDEREDRARFKGQCSGQ